MCLVKHLLSPCGNKRRHTCRSRHGDRSPPAHSHRAACEVNNAWHVRQPSFAAFVNILHGCWLISRRVMHWLMCWCCFAGRGVSEGHEVTKGWEGGEEEEEVCACKLSIFTVWWHVSLRGKLVIQSKHVRAPFFSTFHLFLAFPLFASSPFLFWLVCSLEQDAQLPICCTCETQPRCWQPKKCDHHF